MVYLGKVPYLGKVLSLSAWTPQHHLLFDTGVPREEVSGCCSALKTQMLQKSNLKSNDLPVNMCMKGEWEDTIINFNSKTF